MTAPSLPSDALGPEWALLELLCAGPLRDARRDMFLELLREPGLDHGELVEQGMRHRMIPMLAMSMADEEIAALVLPQLRGELVGALLTNRRRVSVLTRATIDVCRRLAEAGIVVATTKGIPLEHTVYGSVGRRKMMDVDLMIHPRDREPARQIMTDLGFSNGIYEWPSHQIRPLPARIRALYRMSPDHLPHFLRLEPDGAGVIAIDIANSLTWTASDVQVDMDEALAETVGVPVLGGAAELPTLTPPYQFIFTVLHLFREAWFQESISRGKDMLYKFSDLIRLWSAHHEQLRSAVPPLVARYGLDKLLGWVLVHLDRTFGTTVATDLMVSAAVSEEWLASARAIGGADLTWSGTMRERLHARNRMSLFSPPAQLAASR